MKKLLLASIVLFLFAASIALVEVSCSKSNAQTSKVAQLDKLLFLKKNSVTGQTEFWLVDYTGTNLTQINLILPAGLSIDPNDLENTARLSPDGTKFFFRGLDAVAGRGIYSADINGSNVALVTTPANAFSIIIEGAY